MLVDRDSNGNAEFLIQQRAIDKDIDQKPVTNYPIALISEVRIVHCPWCGRNLNKWYGKVVDQLSRPWLRLDQEK